MFKEHGVCPTLSLTVFEIFVYTYICITTLTFRVTWRHQSRDHLIAQVPFPICAPLYPSLSPAIFKVMGMDPNILGSWPWCHVTSSITWPIDSPYSISY